MPLFLLVPLQIYRSASNRRISDFEEADGCALFLSPYSLPPFGILSLVPEVRLAAATAAKWLQLCPTLCDPTDGSPPGSPSLGFSRQEHWSGLPFPSPMHESEK